MFAITPIVVSSFVSTIVFVIIAIVAWRRRQGLPGYYFAMMATCQVFWMAMVTLGYAAVPIRLTVFFATLDAWGYIPGMSFLLLFALTFAGHEHIAQKKWVKAFAAFFAISNLLLISTNPWHRLYWSDFIPQTNNVVLFEHGPAFSYTVISGYALILSALISLTIGSFRGSNIMKRQARWLVAALLALIFLNAAYHTDAANMPGVDWSAATSSLFGLFVLWALYGDKLLDIAPIARNKLISNLSDGMIALDMKNRIVDINRSAVEILGGAENGLLGKNLEDIFPRFSSELAEAPEKEVKFELNIGGQRYYDALLSPLRDEWPKELVGRLIILRNITERKQAEDKLVDAYAQLEEKMRDIQKLQVSLREQAIRDSLTNLHNRRYLTEALAHEFARARREQYPVSFALIDIDNFKEINDSKGHAVGDVMLKGFANILLGFIRTGDIVCRLGGDEFLVVFPKTRGVDAFKIAERLRLFTQASEMAQQAELNFSMTISVGIVEFPAIGADEASILVAADRALYSAKRLGRNQVALMTKANS